MASLLLTPSADGDENLLREGVPPEKIHMVGNVMIDTLLRMLPKAEACWDTLKNDLDLTSHYGLVTLHRPANVDDVNVLAALVKSLDEISHDLPLVFPVHPRTRQRMESNGLLGPDLKLRIAAPLSYLDFLALQKHATVVITDSGGIQEETTCLGVPCLTLRENTERPVTVNMGTNLLIGSDMDRLRREVVAILNGQGKQGQIPPLWDGKAGERVARVVTSTRLAT